jgi:putative transposase
MDEYQSLSHTKWECKYHVVFIPKYRRKVLYGQLRSYLGDVFRELARQKESRIEEGHLQPDHVHMLVSIPPKYAVAQVVGYLKGKSHCCKGREVGQLHVLTREKSSAIALSQEGELWRQSLRATC